MDARIRSAHYFNVTVKDEPGETYRLLSHLAAEGVNLLAFNAIPLTPAQTQFILFPEFVEHFEKAAALIGLHLSEPQHALLVQGDDRLGALAEIHRRLADAEVDVYSSIAVTSGEGSYGYLVYLKPDDVEKAAATLGG